MASWIWYNLIELLCESTCRELQELGAVEAGASTGMANMMARQAASTALAVMSIAILVQSSYEMARIMEMSI
jgi:hypothetical protein